MATDGSAEVEFVRADDLEALQALFAKECDVDGLMSKASLETIPAVAELLSEGDLLQEELDDIWISAPKFPVESAVEGPERIDVDSFVQIYRDIDDIFVDEENDDEGRESSAQVQSKDRDDNGDEEDPIVAGDEAELEVVFKGMCDSSTSLVSKEALKRWDEVKSLLEDGMLGEDEFDAIWEQTAKKPGSNDEIDVEGFLSFNVALDDLFVFDDDELKEDESTDDEDIVAFGKSSDPVAVVDGDDLSPAEIFTAIADDDFLVGMEELQRWGELQDMLANEELLPIELQNLVSEAPKAPGTNDKLNEKGFFALYNSIDNLFEDDDDEEVAATTSDAAKGRQADGLIKKALLAFIEELSRDPDLLPCGLECLESEQEQALDMVAKLEKQPSNLVIAQGGDIQVQDLTGDWDLIFTTSSTMKFNQGLSGLGGSFPNGRFGGVVQKLQASKYTSDIEYKERIEVPAGASFDVTVTGEWRLKGTVNLFTGEPTTVMCVEPEKVVVGPTSNKADHWKSLGPLNLLDITYVDEDLRVMRGNTSTDTIFIFQRRA